ncbi:MAG: hypothetical protein IKY67_06515 [Paludibacteraceae bacterium]|nr:hypothetical protein [Paludibacteraceae bacterium]
MDKFFDTTICDRCHGSLEDGRIMSMFNTQTICMKCSNAERKDPEYNKAVEADHAEIKKGNYNYKGLRG